MSSSSCQAPTPLSLLLLMLYARQPAVIAPRVTFTAVSQGLNEIGAAVPLRTFLSIRFEALVGIEQGRPYTHRPALIKWKSERIRLIGRVDGCETKKIRLDCQGIGIA